jgi:cation transport ATPase
MLIAFGGWLPPVGGAVFQEAIDLAAVLNALRAAVPGGELSDY